MRDFYFYKFDLLNAMRSGRWKLKVANPKGEGNRREGLHPDIGKLVKAAKQRGIAMEINAQPSP